MWHCNFLAKTSFFLLSSINWTNLATWSTGASFSAKQIGSTGNMHLGLLPKPNHDCKQFIDAMNGAKKSIILFKSCHEQTLDNRRASMCGQF